MSEGKEQIKVYGVSELTDVIKGLFRRFDKIYVEGEISGWKVYASGHAYFTVKDENAQLSCVMFSSAIARCKAGRNRHCDACAVRCPTGDAPAAHCFGLNESNLRDWEHRAFD
jgi:hypothetical protein